MTTAKIVDPSSLEAWEVEALKANSNARTIAEAELNHRKRFPRVYGLTKEDVARMDDPSVLQAHTEAVSRRLKALYAGLARRGFQPHQFAPLAKPRVSPRNNEPSAWPPRKRESRVPVAQL